MTPLSSSGIHCVKRYHSISSTGLDFTLYLDKELVVVFLFIFLFLFVHVSYIQLLLVICTRNIRFERRSMAVFLILTGCDSN